MVTTARRTLAVLVATASAATALVATGGTARAAEPVPDQPLSGVASSMYQTNDEVWALAAGGGRVYAGGRFTAVRAPGSTTNVGRTYLASFTASTGAVTSFRVTLNGRVRALALSADNTTLYIGGDFTTVNGVARSRLAAVATSNGALRTGFRADTNARVTALHRHGTTLYVGGEYTTVGGRAKARLAAVSATTGAVQTGFTAALDARPSTLVVDTSLNRLLVGGSFTTVNGQPSPAIASVDATTGAVQPFAAAGVGACTYEVRSIVVDQAADVAYVTSLADAPGCFEGVYKAHVASGEIEWLNECAGAGQSLALVRGSLYWASHTHDCGRMPGGFTGARFPDEFSWYRLNALDPQTGRFGHWQPNTNAAGVTVVGPQVMATDGTQLFVGGDFTTVNGSRQQGLARFAPKGTDAAPATPQAPVAASTKAGTTTVTVRGTWDRDSGVLRYEVQRSVGTTTTTLGSATAESWAWSIPTLRLTDTATPAGSSVRYRVRAVGGAGTSAWSAWSTAVTVLTTDPATTADAVAATAPDLFWRLGDSGPATADASGNGRTATASAGATAQAEGIAAGDGSLLLDGDTGEVVADAPQTLGAQWSTSLWFRSTAQLGGGLAGWSATTEGAGDPTDRVLWVDNDGAVVTALRSQLANGRPGRPGSTPFTLVRSPRTYADGQWHHVVATYDGTTLMLYVDGVAVGSAAATAVPALTDGHLRAGYVDLTTFYSVFGRNFTGSRAPTSHALAGGVDEVASWSTALTPQQVGALWVSGMSGA
jgi:hypothetical protein